MAPFMTIAQGLRQLRAADDARPSVPGEHWAAFGTAVTLITAARGMRSPLWRTLTYLLGGALVVRSVSGRDGPIARLQRRRLR